ncbi:2-hydroxyacyl-CoA dehydratase family protein [Rhodovulum strictum]|uniref:2-hydroxyacyl-CoA dehydratase n=1 Tax=Rhodovulum strictum TaxID=58314 RepID=A0A844BK53_9RHOB|nr:2-hydroxyacyl-CoA dehydratase family protein [Rhodovulum strictum]MRH21392.1 2-hydroxyacyl-CoA dehydratase [Rhodovulum strictum]
MASETIALRDDGLNLAELARLDTAKKARTGEGLESQLAYLAETRADHAYSPAVQKLFDLVLSYIEDAEANHRAGRQPAAWMCGGLWSPLYYACDTVPISINEVGRLGSSDAMTVAEDYFQLPKESCSMVGAVLGEFFLRADRTVKRLATYNMMCEPLNIAWELLRAEGVDVFRVEGANRPNTEDEAGRLRIIQDFIESELRDLAIWLHGRPVDETRLSVELLRYNRILAKMRRILHLRVENPLYIRSLATMYLLIGTGTYFGKPDAYEEVLDGLLEELERPDHIRPYPENLVRLVWSGGRGQEFGVYKTIDDSGGAVTAWHTPDEWTRGYREDLPPLQAYADYIITGRTMIGTPVRHLKRIEETIAPFQARGILFYGYVGCSFAGIHREIQSTHFQRLGIPTIALEGSFQVGPPSGQLLTRIRAFVEMLSR